jgi:hypothetical protein
MVAEPALTPIFVTHMNGAIGMYKNEPILCMELNATPMRIMRIIEQNDNKMIPPGDFSMIRIMFVSISDIFAVEVSTRLAGTSSTVAAKLVTVADKGLRRRSL